MKNLIAKQIARLATRLTTTSQRHLRHTRSLDLVQLQQLRNDLLEESTIDVAYLLLVISSCLIATLGLLSNSAAVIIGAMVIAPLMLPIRGLAFGALEGDIDLFRRGLAAIVVGTLLSVVISWGLGALTGLSTFGSEVWARSKPNLLDLGIAITAGGISGYTKVQPKISGSIVGTAIAVALMPPVCVIGLGLAKANSVLSLGALLLYLTNLLGITFSCMVTFFLAGYTPFSQARRALTLAGIFTSLLLVPLGISFVDLVHQNRLEASLKKALLNQTITFQRVQLVDIQTNWLVNPPEVRLTVRSSELITPRQVQLLEEFVQQSMKRPFTLIFEVSQVSEIRRNGSREPSRKSQ